MHVGFSTQLKEQKEKKTIRELKQLFESRSMSEKKKKMKNRRKWRIDVTKNARNADPKKTFHIFFEIGFCPHIKSVHN